MFEVAGDADKANVKAAVEAMFNVKVVAVNLVNVHSKTKSFRFRTGSRKGWRARHMYAFSEGQTIDVTAKP